MKVTLICNQSSDRLRYTLDFIFNDLLGSGYTLLHEIPENFHQPLLIYGDHKQEGAYHIQSEGLLFEEHIRKVLPEVGGESEQAILFRTNAGDHSFDIFSAVFFLLSRYEEYLPYTADLYGRFPHTQSLASKNNFLQYPVVNKWVNELGLKLKKRFPALIISPPVFEFLPTYDIDMAWAYRNKGFTRNLGGWIKSPQMSRLKILARLAPDPFDSFVFLRSLHSQYKLEPIYFWLVAKRRGKFDRNICPGNASMQSLIKEHRNYRNALHPSWFSHSDGAALKTEKETLEKLLGYPVNSSRQHYLRFTLPETYNMLIKNGIKDEYSMGYGTINGFRASTSSTFLWFNLEKNAATSLKVHPFCFMDANSFYEQKQNAEESYREITAYHNSCRKEGGRMITIFHNNFLGTDPKHRGWRELYERFIREVHS